MEIFSLIGRDFDSNVYVVPGAVPTIIDTGTGFHSREVLATVAKIVKPASLAQILLTHEHFDHVGGTLDLLAATGKSAKVGAHSDVVGKLRKGQSTFAEMLGGTMPSIETDLPLTDNMTLRVGDTTVEVLHTPGHSPGSLCLYEATDKVLFSGDTVFAQGGFGRYDFPGGSQEKLTASLQRLTALDVEGLYAGHGPVVESGGRDHIRAAWDIVRTL